jgi:hypothetical protein
LAWLHSANRDHEEVTMKTQTVRTNTTIMGPFLTLILNSRPRPKPASENPFKVCDDTRIPAPILRQEQATAETQTIDVRRRMLGPFVSLILDLSEQKAAERLRFAAEHNRPEQALCVRIHVGR